MNRTFTFAFAALVPALLTAQATSDADAGTVRPHKHAPQPTTANITSSDLMTRLYIFADDSMMGREAGTVGNVKGTDYIAAEAKRLGLIPAGEDGGYFQTIPLKTRMVDPASTLAAGGSSLTFGTEWAVSGGTGATLSGAPVVYGGLLGDSASMISPDSVAGKVVVYSLATLPASPRIFRGASRYAPNAAAVVIISPDQFLSFTRRSSTFVDDPSAAGRTPSVPLFLVTASGADRVFDTPVAALKAGAAGRSISANVMFRVAPVLFPARNVVAILPGSDRKLKGEFVAVGAHNDHIGASARPVNNDSLRLFNHIVRPGGAEDAAKQATPAQQAMFDSSYAAWKSAHPGAVARMDSISNGADDDGSGSVAVLEIAQKLASLKTKPKRSILFVWHVGEEKGLLGSAYFTDHPTVVLDSIIAQLNMDMVGRGSASDVTGVTKDGDVLHGGPNYLQLVGSRRLSKELGDIVEQVNTEHHHGFTFDYAMDANGHPMNIYCRSDHYEYARYGIPITFFTTGGHSDYHQVTDEPEDIDYDHMARVANLVEDITLHVANLDHRIVVDQPKPDPRGACRQ